MSFFQQVGIVPVIMDPRQLVQLDGGCFDRSPSFLAFVEQQVAVQSFFFMGTASSSVSESVLYERLAVGKANAHDWLDRPFP